ncbi:unnamed protein product [Euphydryas editha]|uniref:Transposase n=1 Tax=Euphydryas editha TaxID=104508 RepID=A0AAU9UPQ1_EUPED|nr:unnamed protein product [Euphydryas editha]
MAKRKQITLEQRSPICTLCEEGNSLTGCVAGKKPKLTIPHNKIDSNQWENVLWTDESKFQIFGFNRRVFVRRLKGENASEACTVLTMKHSGGNVTVWRCFGNNKPENLIRITVKLTKEGYFKIIQDSAIPSRLNLIGPDFTFQQDNDRKHSSTRKL